MPPHPHEGGFSPGLSPALSGSQGDWPSVGDPWALGVLASQQGQQLEAVVGDLGRESSESECVYYVTKYSSSANQSLRNYL